MKKARTVTAQELARCERFRVDYPGGHLGIVEVVLHGQYGEPEGVAVRGGLFGTRTTIVPVDEIADVDQEAGRLVLFDRPQLGRAEHFAEVLRSHGRHRKS